MILSVREQAILFLMAVAIGFVLAFVYDWIRVARRIISHGWLATNIEDILYWVFVSIVVFAVMLQRNYGEIRFFSIAGVLIGMGLYAATLSRLFLSVSMAVVDFITRTLMFILNIILTPVRLLIKILSYPYRAVSTVLKSRTEAARRRAVQLRALARVRKKRLKNNLKIILKKS